MPLVELRPYIFRLIYASILCDVLYFVRLKCNWCKSFVFLLKYTETSTGGQNEIKGTTLMQLKCIEFSRMLCKDLFASSAHPIKAM